MMAIPVFDYKMPSAKMGSLDAGKMLFLYRLVCSVIWLILISVFGAVSSFESPKLPHSTERSDFSFDNRLTLAFYVFCWCAVVLLSASFWWLFIMDDGDNCEDYIASNVTKERTIDQMIDSHDFASIAQMQCFKFGANNVELKSNTHKKVRLCFALNFADCSRIQYFVFCISVCIGIAGGNIHGCRRRFGRYTD